MSISQLPDWVQLRGEYKSNRVPIEHVCLKCDNPWLVRPYDILNGSGCPNCLTKSYSKISLEWLNSLSKKLRLKIRHTENGGEIAVPSQEINNRNAYRLDGFNTKYNLAFEFLGDYWHKLDEPDSAQHIKTIKKINRLLALGYSVVYVWESDYRAGSLGTLLTPKGGLRSLAERGKLKYRHRSSVAHIGG